MSNYKFKTQSIKGKDYVPVQERVKFFRQEEQYKGWSIVNDIIQLEENSCVIKCSIINESGMVIASAHAQEDRTSSMINKTSYVENGESSAVGRALAFLGIGIDTSIASSNEVSIAIEKQNTPESKKPLTGDIIASMKKAISEGKRAQVETALTKYTYSESQVTEIFEWVLSEVSM